MNTTYKRVSDLTIGDVFVSCATRHEVLSNTLAEKRTPTAKPYRTVRTHEGDLMIPADLLVRLV